MRIAIDIDDVLFDWSGHAHAAAEAAGITNGKRITQWAFYNDYGCTGEELWAVLYAAYDDGMLLKPPYNETVEQLQRLRDLGHTLHLVTARGFEPDIAHEVRRATGHWLYYYDIPHDTLTFAQDKGIIRADVGLDDSVKNCTAMAEAGTVPWLMTRWHNESTDAPFPRVKSLAGFVTAIEWACL